MVLIPAITGPERGSYWRSGGVRRWSSDLCGRVGIMTVSGRTTAQFPPSRTAACCAAPRETRPPPAGTTLRTFAHSRSGVPMQIFDGQIRFGIHAGPQHTTFQDYLALWRAAEDLGYDWASVFDHF